MSRGNNQQHLYIPDSKIKNVMICCKEAWTPDF